TSPACGGGLGGAFAVSRKLAKRFCKPPPPTLPRAWGAGEGVRLRPDWPFQAALRALQVKQNGRLADCRTAVLAGIAVFQAAFAGAIIGNRGSLKTVPKD
ncbi:hypothetical protein HMPREF9120_00184, partial [Neisseria sp. oral taxon 020 str. F0370]